MQLKIIKKITNEVPFFGFLSTLLASLLIGMLFVFEVNADHRIFRRANFSNEFELTTPEGINARGSAEVRSSSGRHKVKLDVNGLTPGAAFVVINHWFDPVPARGIGPTDPSEDPSCNGHFQFLGADDVADPEIADHKGRLKVNTRVPQLAPHIWVVDLVKFVEVTNGLSQAPASPDAFVIGGLMIPFEDLLEVEDDFENTDPLTKCNNS